MYAWAVFYTFAFVLGAFFYSEQARFRKSKRVEETMSEFMAGLGQVMMFAAGLAGAITAALYVIKEADGVALAAPALPPCPADALAGLQDMLPCLLERMLGGCE